MPKDDCASPRGDREITTGFKATHTVHDPRPDYTRPPLVIGESRRRSLEARLARLYGPDRARELLPELERICRVYYAHKPPEMAAREKDCDPGERFTQRDVILITYGDLIKNGGESPLTTLARFCDSALHGAINTIHILPFFPFSSDRGFSVIDFQSVDPQLGTWQDIEALEGCYQLMFDGVINHVSSKSEWFQEFLNGNPDYGDFFTSFKSRDELTPEEKRLIFRPRTSDILSEFQSINGPVFVWTTFSEDQIDLNFKNPKVLLQVVDILLTYVRKGADIIRLDAVTYLWEQPGTNCIHLEETHEIVKLLREILDEVAPGAALITETNVPHQENISYFGDGTDEAQMVYNFALPPLVLHTFYTQDAGALSRWAADLSTPSETTTFFNFLDSHDGVGVMAVKGILNEEEIGFLVRKVQDRGGFVSYKSLGDGGQEPYELNITWFSAINDEGLREPLDLQVKRYAASRAVAMVLQGVPGVYLHGLIGSSNDVQAVLASKSKRAINRTVLSYHSINQELEDPTSKISRLNLELGRIIQARTNDRAFHPNGAQEIIQASPKVFAVMRTSPEGDRRVLCLINISSDPVAFEYEPLGEPQSEKRWRDILSGRDQMVLEDGLLRVSLEPYDVLLLQPAVQLDENLAV